MSKKERLPIDVLDPHDTGLLLNQLLLLADSNGDYTPSFTTHGFDVSGALDYVLRTVPSEIDISMSNHLDYIAFTDPFNSKEHLHGSILYWLRVGYELSVGVYGDIAGVAELAAKELFGGQRSVVDLSRAMSYGVRGHTIETVLALYKFDVLPSYHRKGL